MVVVEEPVPLNVLSEEAQSRGDSRKGQVELRDLIEVEEGDLLGLRARGEVGGLPFLVAVAAVAAAHELAAEQEVGLADRRDVLLLLSFGRRGFEKEGRKSVSFLFPLIKTEKKTRKKKKKTYSGGPLPYRVEVRPKDLHSGPGLLPRLPGRPRRSRLPQL